jgi:hypothetical protein
MMYFKPVLYSFLRRQIISCFWHAWIIILFVNLSCASIYLVDGSKQVVTIGNEIIKRDTLWQGTIIVDGMVKLAKGATLWLAPGTRVEFVFRDKNQDGIGDNGIFVNGQLIAEGSREQNIVFTSHSNPPAPASWGEIIIEYSKGSKFKFCRFEYAHWALHMHFSKVEINQSVFENNEGGLRFRSGPVAIRNNLIRHNKTGLRFIHSQPVIEHNTISQNLTGIFIREGVRHPSITHNNFTDNKDYHLKLGESQQHSIDCPNNWWGTTQTELIDKYIFDQLDADYIGRINYIPFATQAQESMQ